LPGVSKLVAALRRSQAELKVIGLGAKVKTKLAGINAWRQKPGSTQEPTKHAQEWLEAVKDVFVSHKRAA
jgi:hypothetical protein